MFNIFKRKKKLDEDLIIAKVLMEIKDRVDYQCRALVYSMFERTSCNDRVESAWGKGFMVKVPTLRKTIFDYLIDESFKRFKKEIEYKAIARIQGEEFLDAFIERINKKQLKG